MIGMVVRHQNAIQAAAIGGKQLLAKVGPAVHEQMLVSALHED